MEHLEEAIKELVSIIALAFFSVAFALVWVVPMVEKSYSDLGMCLPSYLGEMINISCKINNTWWIWLIAIIGGMSLFEWKCKSENKDLIRTAIARCLGADATHWNNGWYSHCGHGFVQLLDLVLRRHGQSLLS
ncbi:MAG: hypothetical protein JW829_20725 [Pirellulales bacterium]|nr:hypothetical protein [Pirellulales bacterium]